MKFKLNEDYITLLKTELLELMGNNEAIIEYIAEELVQRNFYHTYKQSMAEKNPQILFEDVAGFIRIYELGKKEAEILFGLINEVFPEFNNSFGNIQLNIKRLSIEEQKSLYENLYFLQIKDMSYQEMEYLIKRCVILLKDIKTEPTFSNSTSINKNKKEWKSRDFSMF